MGLKNFYSGKKVFLTGHTGFKGGWLTLLLEMLGAEVTGYALEPPTDPSLFQLADVASSCCSLIDDVRDGERLREEMKGAAPDIVFHLAAQPLVRESYQAPLETYSTNVMGTVNLLEAVRQTPSVKAVVVVTTDKVYENRDWCWGYRENESLGGVDPYSSSKACAELVTAAYRSSFFVSAQQNDRQVSIASARAGNVIGGGDWADDRLLPDCIRALLAEQPIEIRNPGSIRPWQHVFESISGYLLLAEKLYNEGNEFSEAWNFGPAATDEWSVEEVVKVLCRFWGAGASYRVVELPQQPHEARTLSLDSTKAINRLGWKTRWPLEKALQSIIEWNLAWQNGADMKEICRRQLNDYLNSQESETDGGK